MSARSIMFNHVRGHQKNVVRHFSIFSQPQKNRCRIFSFQESSGIWELCNIQLKAKITYELPNKRQRKLIHWILSVTKILQILKFNYHCHKTQRTCKLIFRKIFELFSNTFMGLTPVLVPCKAKYIYTSQTLVPR